MTVLSKTMLMKLQFYMLIIKVFYIYTDKYTISKNTFHNKVKCYVYYKSNFTINRPFSGSNFFYIKSS